MQAAQDATSHTFKLELLKTLLSTSTESLNLLLNLQFHLKKAAMNHLPQAWGRVCNPEPYYYTYANRSKA